MEPVTSPPTSPVTVSGLGSGGVKPSGALTRGDLGPMRSPRLKLHPVLGADEAQQCGVAVD